jgi:hypothetical protein
MLMVPFVVELEPPRVALPVTVSCEPELKRSVQDPEVGTLPTWMLAATAFETSTVTVKLLLILTASAAVGMPFPQVDQVAAALQLPVTLEAQLLA